jgi:hypothetical protein
MSNNTKLFKLIDNISNAKDYDEAMSYVSEAFIGTEDNQLEQILMNLQDCITTIN